MRTMTGIKVQAVKNKKGNFVGFVSGRDPLNFKSRANMIGLKPFGKLINKSWTTLEPNRKRQE